MRWTCQRLAAANGQEVLQITHHIGQCKKAITISRLRRLDHQIGVAHKKEADPVHTVIPFSIVRHVIDGRFLPRCQYLARFTTSQHARHLALCLTTCSPVGIAHPAQAHIVTPQIDSRSGGFCVVHSDLVAAGRIAVNAGSHILFFLSARRSRSTPGCGDVL